MGTLFSTLDIARSGLQTAQVQMDVAGHNIANVNTEGFSRQRVTLAARYPDYRSFGALGRGVEIQQIERLREVFLDTVFREQVPALGSAEVRATYFSRIEDIFQEPEDEGLGYQLNRFFDALNDFANNVEEQPLRQSVVAEAEGIVTTLRAAEERLRHLRTNANEEVRDMVPEINSLAAQIASLNVHIRDAELGGVKANDLRDQRDVLLDQLARLVTITTRERTDGQIDILIGGDSLVSAGRARELEAVRNAALDPERPDLVEIRFADNGLLVNVRGGELYGALTMRDTEIPEIDARIDTIAATLIEQINRIHSQGNGLANLSGTITTSNLVNDAATALQDAGLPFDVTAGTFDVVVYDAANNATVTTVTVSATTTLQDLANTLNAIPNFSASVGADGVSLELGTAPPYSYSFTNDTTGALTALGMNGLFTGYDARTIGVNADILNDPLLLTSGFSLDALETGDNTAALAMAEVRNLLILEDDSATINDYYESTIVQIGIRARTNQDALTIEQSFIDDFETRRQQVSGVSLDEEVTYLLRYQRAYEASARVVTTVNTMLDALLNMV